MPLFTALLTTLLRLTGLFIMKKILINWLLPTIIDALIGALKGLSKQSDNTIDDALVDTVAANRDSIITEIKNSF